MKRGTSASPRVTLRVFEDDPNPNRDRQESCKNKLSLFVARKSLKQARFAGNLFNLFLRDS